MKIYISSVTLAFLSMLTGCVDSSVEGGSDWVERHFAGENAKMFRQATPVASGFSEGERVTSRGVHIGITPDGNKYAYEKTLAPRGLMASLAISKNKRYTYNPLFGDWNLKCEVNPMTDRSRCNLHFQHNLLLTGSSPLSLTTVCLSKHDFPGRTASIRVDGGEVVNLGEDGCKNSSALVRGILTAKKVSISFVEWPYDSRKSFELSEFDSSNLNNFMKYLSSI